MDKAFELFKQSINLDFKFILSKHKIYIILLNFISGFISLYFIYRQFVFFFLFFFFFFCCCFFFLFFFCLFVWFFFWFFWGGCASCLSIVHFISVKNYVFSLSLRNVLLLGTSGKQLANRSKHKVCSKQFSAENFQIVIDLLLHVYVPLIKVSYLFFRHTWHLTKSFPSVKYNLPSTIFIELRFQNYLSLIRHESLRHNHLVLTMCIH